MIDFHFKFKQFKAGMDKNAVADILNLEGSRNKLIKYFSSGMKQTAKTGACFLCRYPHADAG
jgi:ABC-type multidrug transport system ATPase subunit